MDLSFDICHKIIDVFNKREDYDFDSHEFIAILKLCYPTIYYDALLKYASNRDIEEAYQQLHSDIGRFLSNNREDLGIKPIGKHESLNYKGISSENEMWQKL